MAEQKLGGVDYAEVKAAAARNAMKAIEAQLEKQKEREEKAQGVTAEDYTARAKKLVNPQEEAPKAPKAEVKPEVKSDKK